MKSKKQDHSSSLFMKKNYYRGNFESYRFGLSTKLDQEIRKEKARFIGNWKKIIIPEAQKFVKENREKVFKYLLEKKINAILNQKRSEIDQRIRENTTGKYKGLEKELSKLSIWSPITYTPTSNVHIQHGKTEYGEVSLSKNEIDELHNQMKSQTVRYTISDLINVGFAPSISKSKFIDQSISELEEHIDGNVFPLSKIIYQTIKNGDITCKDNSILRGFCLMHYMDEFNEWEMYYDPNI